MYRSVLCLIAFVGLSGVSAATARAGFIGATTWFQFLDATLDGQPLDPNAIDVQGGTDGFPVGTPLVVTTMAGPGLYEFTIALQLANRTPFRIDAWNLSLDANSAVTLESFDPIGPFVLSDGPFNTLPATGPGLILDSGGQVGIGAGDGVLAGDGAPLAILVFSTDFVPAGGTVTHEILAGIGQFGWEPPLFEVFFADNPGIPADAVNTFAPNPVITINQVPEPVTIIFVVVGVVALRRRRRPSQTTRFRMRRSTRTGTSSEDVNTSRPNATDTHVFFAPLLAMAVLLTSVLSFHVAELRAGTVFVDRNALGANTGQSWTNAFTDLQNALAIAQPGDQIWVADGVYRPDSVCAGARASTFALKSGVQMFGGFLGIPTELNISDRASLFSRTILSGDITGTDFQNCCPLAIALDLRPGQRKLYWTDDRQQKIRRANADDGLNVELLAARSPLPPAVLFRIALDTANDQMYWAEIGRGLIMRADADKIGRGDRVHGCQEGYSLS